MIWLWGNIDNVALPFQELLAVVVGEDEGQGGPLIADFLPDVLLGPN